MLTSNFSRRISLRSPNAGFQDKSFRDHTGGFDFKKIEEETPPKVTALLQEHDSDQIARIVIEVELAEPHHILKLQTQPIARPPELALPHLSEIELILRSTNGWNLRRPTNFPAPC
jgi:hypothetical protein